MDDFPSPCLITRGFVLMVLISWLPLEIKVWKTHHATFEKFWGILGFPFFHVSFAGGYPLIN